MHLVEPGSGNSSQPERAEPNLGHLNYERHTTRESGALDDVLDMFESHVGPASNALTTLGIPLKHSVWTSDRLRESRYRVVNAHSISTDSDVIFGGNLEEQLAQARGQSVANIHLNIFGCLEETSTQLGRMYDKEELKDITWAWEIGRLGGILLNRIQDPKWRMTLATQRLGIASFMGRVANELGQPGAVPKPDIEQMPPDAIHQYYSLGFPERIATTIGNHFTRYYFGADEELIKRFNLKLWDYATRPAKLASVFVDDPDYHTAINYADLAAASPLNQHELDVYIEHLGEN